MPSPLSQLFRFLLKLLLGLVAAVFAVSMLIVALIVIVLSLLKARVTGRKPAPAVVFGRFQRFSPQDIFTGSRSGNNNATGAKAGEVVDVEAREIREDRRIP